MKRFIIALFVAVGMLAMGSTVALAAGPDDCSENSTIVPGHCGDRNDADDNGIPDEGEVVSGKYTSLYAYDANGGWYWDLGDG